MSSQRWHQVEQLYHAARNRQASERDRFLREACPDEDVRREVESLLVREPEAETFLETPALEMTAQSLAKVRTASMPGQVFGPYEIVGFVGAGGMGEVYRARDSRIGRDVAIKLLPPAFASDPERLRRFEQEAKATGALNHPNILAIHDVGVQDDSPYVVYELLEGQTLRDRLREGALPRRKAIEYARQIALGLAAAHARGITHCDLKPENLFVTHDGRIKILDFGLAKLILQETPPLTDETVTITSPNREFAGIAGTPGYMAPEQLKGGSVSPRSDIFNLGAILYEMLTGERPFPGSSTIEVLNAILKHDPVEISEAGQKFDPALNRLLRRCLEKNPNERIQSALDLAFDLEALLLPAQRAHESRWKKPGIGVALAGTAAAAVLGLVSFFAGRKMEKAQPHPTPTFQRLTYRLGVITGARFDPGGRNIIYSAAWDGKPVEVFSTQVGSPESRPLGLASAGVLGVSAAGELAISLGCELNWAECRGTLARMPLSGGAAREVLQDVFYADWAPDGKNLAVVRPVDGKFRLEYPIGKVLYETAGWITYPRFSPGGDRIAFLDHPTLGENTGAVSVVDLKANKTTLSSGWKNLKGLAWSPSGEEVWFSANRTSPAPLLYGVTLAGKERIVLQAPGWMRLQEISRDGRVLLIQASPRSRIVCQTPDAAAERDLSWFDWSTAADLSADGRKLLFYEWGAGVAGNPTVYLRDTRGGDAVRLGDGRALALSPDGQWALAVRAGPPSRLVLLPTGAGEEKLLPPAGLNEYYSAAWFPDGKRILFVAGSSDAGPRSYVQNVDGGEARAITDEAAQAILISPDGKTLAATDAGADYEMLDVDGGKPRQIRGPLPGDELIQWSGDGRFLYVRAPGDSAVEFFRIELATGRRDPWKRAEAGDPVGLLGIQPATVHMTPDGKSFVYSYWKALTELYLVDKLK